MSIVQDFGTRNPSIKAPPDFVHRTRWIRSWSVHALIQAISEESVHSNAQRTTNIRTVPAKL
jgi:hypothetical protein